MEILSTKYYEEGTEQLIQKTITCEMKRAVRISVISAYYSVKFLEGILNKVNKTMRRKCKLELVFNGFSGERLQHQIEELRGFKSTLEDRGFQNQNISILLNRKTTLFHAKLYFITNENGSLWFSGSANASMAAFETNEELLIKTNTKVRDIKRYISRVIADSIAIEMIDLENIKESNLIGFFRTGSIYFKPNNQISFTFSELNLPDLVEKKLAVIERPKHTNHGKAWGAYNLKLSLGLTDDEETEQKSRLSLKPWSVETCFGYWVPNKYRKIVDKNIAEKSRNSKAKLEYILHLLRQQGEEMLVSEYKTYLLDAKRILNENSIVDWQPDEINLIVRFKKFVNRIVSKLSDPDKLDKLCRPLVSTGMPEIWEDNLAYDDFSESFYEYISGCLYEQQPLIVKSMKNKIKFEKGDDSVMMNKRFLKYFDSGAAEWSDDNWLS